MGIFHQKAARKRFKKYRSSREYELRKQRQADLDDIMSNELTPDQKGFVEEILFEIISFHEHESDLLYQQGMKDCVWLLKNLRILA